MADLYVKMCDDLLKKGKNIFTDVHLPQIMAYFDEMNGYLQKRMTKSELIDFFIRSFEIGKKVQDGK